MLCPILSQNRNVTLCDKRTNKRFSDIWSDGKYAFISQASGGRYNERSEWSITLYTVT